MTDNVLQSFCERCGARFTQPAPAEKPPPAAGMLGRFRRRTAEPESAPDDAAALPISEAFRDTFHFCMGCRRYNCPDCWNEREGHCLSCRPHQDPATAAAPGSDAPELGRVKNPAPAPRVQPAETTVAWPSGDSGRAEPAAGQAASPWGPVRPPASAAAAQGGSQVGAADDTAAAPAANPADLPWTPAPELDPWRGVVFSSQDRGRVEPSVAPAWEPPAAPPVPPSAPGAAEDLGVLASLIDNEAHVDAADWARASSSVVGSGSLKASRNAEAGGPDVTVAEDVSVVAAEADEPEPAAAEEVPVAAPVPDEPEPAAADEVPVAAPVPDEPEPAAAEESAAAEEVPVAAPVPDEPEPAAAELDGVDEAPLAPLPETEAWLDIARRGFDQMPDPGAGTVETAASPDDWVTDEGEQPGFAQQPTPAGALTPTPVPPPPGSPVTTPPPAAPLALPPLAPVQEMPPRQAAPATPPPGLAVWATPIDPGPFATPYQPPPPEATIFMSDAPVTPVAPDARQVALPAAPPGPQPIVPPGPLSPLPPASQAMPGHAGALPPTSPPSTAYAPPPPGVAAAPPPVSRQGAASRACPSCSLPLSTKARFCRRCGAPQPA